MEENEIDCCFTNGNNWFRYRVGAIILHDGNALFAYSDIAKHYYTVGGGVHVGEYAESAVLREVKEETGCDFKIERPLCLIENFFDGTGGFFKSEMKCHTIEYYFLMKPNGMTEFNAKSFGQDGAQEKIVWLPIDRLDEYDIRPKLLVDLCRNPPANFKTILRDERK